MLLVAAREASLLNQGIGGLDIDVQDLDFFRDPELRTPEVTAFEVWHLEEEPLVKQLFWVQFVAPSRPMVVREGLRHWSPDWQDRFPAALRAEKEQIMLTIWSGSENKLSEGAVRRHMQVRLPLDQALQQIVRAPCGGGVSSAIFTDMGIEEWGCAVEGAPLPIPRPLHNRGKSATLSSLLTSLEPPYAALLRRVGVSVWLTAAHHRTLLQFNSEESFVVQIAGRQRIRLYDPFQTPFLHRTARSEIQCRVATSVVTRRPLTLEECPWLDAELPNGTLLFREPTTPRASDESDKATHRTGMITVARLPWNFAEQAAASRGSKQSEKSAFVVPADALSLADTVNGTAHGDYVCDVATDTMIENISPLGGLEDLDELRDEFPLAVDAKPIEVELGPGDVLYLPALWWYERTTIAPAGHEGNSGDDVGGEEGDRGEIDGLSGVSVALEYRYAAHSKAMLHVAAALRDQMSLDQEIG